MSTHPRDTTGIGQGAFGLFGAVLTVGLTVSVLALPVVTLLPALAAGSAHLRRHLTRRQDRLIDLAADIRSAIRGRVWRVVLGTTGLFGLLIANGWTAASGALPGGQAVLVGTVAVAAGVVLVLLRTVGRWAPGDDWPDVVRVAARDTGADPVGTVLLAVGLGLCAMLVWMLPALVVLIPGLLALATVAVEQRRTARLPGGCGVDPMGP